MGCKSWAARRGGGEMMNDVRVRGYFFKSGVKWCKKWAARGKGYESEGIK